MVLSLKRFSPFLAVLVLGACSYVHDKEFQTVHIDTPGAVGAKCHLEVDKIRYPVYAPEAISIPRTKGDMKIDCLAPGNRSKKAVVPSRRSVLFWQNFLNGFAGAPLDLVSGAAYEFPDYIQISFYDVEPKPYNLPLHEYNPAGKPSQRTLEEFRPSQSVMNKDRYAAPVEIKKRSRVRDSGGLDFGSVFAEPSDDAGAAVDLSVKPVSMSDLSMPDSVQPNGLAIPPVSVSGAFDDDFSRFNHHSPIDVFPVE